MRRAYIMALLLGLAILAPVALPASPVQWGGLEAGPWTVGFRVVDTVDPSRGWRARHDLDGRPVGGETGRPMRLYIWYPAGDVDGPPLTYRDYQRLALRPGDPPDMFESALAGQRSFLSRVTRHEFSDAEWEGVMQAATASHLDAAPAPGPFPVVLGCTGVTRNSVFFEYLASHGYVVVSVPLAGHFTENALQFTPNPVSIELAVQDMQFTYGFLRGLPNVDLDRLGLWAFSSLSIYSLEFQSRNMAAAAMLHVEGWEGFKRGREILDESEFFDPAAIRAPYLLLKKAAEESNAAYASDSTVFESLRYSNRQRVLVDSTAHGDFNSQLIAVYASEGQRRRYEDVCRTGRAFLDASLAADESRVAGYRQHLARMAGDGRIVFDDRRAEVAVPTTAEFVAAFEAGGDVRRRAIDRVRAGAATGGAPYLSRRILSRFGYGVMRSDPTEAVPLFKVMTEVFPLSGESWVGYSDALESAGSRREAWRAAETALKCLDGDATLTDSRRERLRTGLEEKIADLSRDP